MKYTSLISKLAAVTLLFGCGSTQRNPNEALAASGGSGSEEVHPDGSTAATLPGPLEIAGVFNVRQVGMLPAGAKRLKEHIVIRSGDLHDLDDSGCAALHTLGVAAIVDLRDEPDLSNRPDNDCGKPSRITGLSLPKLLPPGLDNYTATLDALEPKLAPLFSTLSQTDGTVLIHCVIGRDRATLVTSLVLLALGVQDADVLENAATNQDASVTVEAGWFAGVFGRIAASGGVDSYLALHGVSADVLAQVRTAMTE